MALVPSVSTFAAIYMVFVKFLTKNWEVVNAICTFWLYLTSPVLKGEGDFMGSVELLRLHAELGSGVKRTVFAEKFF